MKNSLGVYIHVPFCKKKCRYCDFCSVSGKDEGYMLSYAKELCKRIKDFLPRATDHTVDTVYFGGGTPTLLPIDAVKMIMDAVRGFHISPDAEITMECNPATADLTYLSRIRDMGVNRISIGLQSASDRELTLLGRAHNREDFLLCFENARRSGFDNISADLMYGIPDQTLESFSRSLDLLADLSPEHISAYGLTIEEGTYFHKHLSELDIADDDMQAEMYSMMCARLKERGYRRYEISNFAKPERESRHNTRYWKGLDYVGFGVAAHSCFDNERFGNSRNIDGFLRGEDITEERYTLDLDERKKEYVMLGMRMENGISLSQYEDRFGVTFPISSPTVKNYIKNEFLRLEDDSLSFTEKGFLVSNVILSELIEL